jgi:predicted transcriptional regulator
MTEKILTHLSTWRALAEIVEHASSNARDIGTLVGRLLATGQIERSETHPRGGGTVFKYRRTGE